MKHVIYIFILFMCSIASCDKSSPDCFKKAGSSTTVTRELTPFNSVVLEANVEVILKQGSEHKVEIMGPKNLLEKIQTSVADNKLTIDDRNGCNFVRGYKHRVKVIVTCPRFDRAITNSIGTIATGKDIVQDSLFVITEGGDMTVDGTFNVLKTSSHGNGNIYFNGTANKLFIYMYGTNFLYGQAGTINNYVYVEQISLGDVHINAPNNGQLDYHVWRTGNIYYTGEPSVVSGKCDQAGSVVKQ